MIRIPSVLFPERVSILFFSELALSFVCFLAGTALSAGPAAIERPVLIRIALAAFSVVLGCYLNGLYRKLQWRSRVSLVLHLSSVFGIALLIQGLVAYLVPGLQLARAAMLTGAALNFLAMVPWRITYAALLSAVFASERVLFAGTGEVLREIAARMTARPELGYTVVGFLSDDDPPGAWIEGGEVVGGIEDIDDAVRRLRPKRLIVGAGDMRSRLPVAALTRAKRQGVAVYDAGTAYELVCGRVCARTFRPSQIIFADELAQRPNSLAVQSIYTNLVALVACAVALPLLALAVIAIRVTSRGPALITEQFAGFNNIPFSASRLRCTAENAPARLTRVGAAIRALHLEYLPRVINLVRGEMALVGPEPQRIEFTEALSQLIPFYRQRQVVKPGITGWTQIQDAPGSVTDALRDIECDLYYTKHFSLALDAYILLHTIRGILPFQDR